MVAPRAVSPPLAGGMSPARGRRFAAPAMQTEEQSGHQSRWVLGLKAGGQQHRGAVGAILPQRAMPRLSLRSPAVTAPRGSKLSLQWGLSHSVL